MKSGLWGTFKLNLFRNLMSIGATIGGIAGWLFGSETGVWYFWIVTGACAGMYLGFLAAMFASD